MVKNLEKEKRLLKEVINKNINFCRVNSYIHLKNLHLAEAFDVISKKEMINQIIKVPRLWAISEYEMSRNVRLRWEYLTKLFYYAYYSQYHKEWVKLGITGIEYVGVLNMTHKFPVKDRLYKCLWLDTYSAFEIFHNDLVEELNKSYLNLPSIEPNLDGCRRFIKVFYDWVSEELSEKGFITVENSYKELMELLNREYTK